VIVELRGLVAAEPLRERLHALLMTALVRDGQQAGALAAYQAARRVMIDELGAEPGPELQRLQQQVLAGPPPGRPGPGRPQPGRPQPGRPPPGRPPAGGPAGPDRLIGRTAELAELTGLLDQAAAQTVVISVIAGPAGAGKTALARHWARQVRDRFPDGQLYLNLRGHGPGPAVAPADALAEFLAALGGRAPAELEERAARYRSLLAGRRMLVVLDDAASAEHVRPLLPGAAGCAALVTSRDPLIGLVARDGARRLDLEPLPPGVRARPGPDR
jgi:hypothetical protein